MPDNLDSITVTESFGLVIWEPVYQQAVVSSTDTLTQPLVLKTGTLLTRNPKVPTATQPYSYKQFTSLTVPYISPTNILPGAILMDDLTLTETDKIRTVRVLIQGLVRLSDVTLHGVDTPLTIFDIDYFQRYGIQLLETDVNFIHDNGGTD